MIPTSQILEQIANQDTRSIARRYFISNGFDGTLTSIGIIVGAVLSGIPNGTIVIQIGLGAAVGLGTSAVWSVWEIERAETLAEIKQLEQAMLTDLDDTQIERSQKVARIIRASVSGIGPLLGIIIPIAPFLFENSLLTMTQAGVIGVALGILILGLFGAYMSSISGQRWYLSAIRMGLAGLVVAIINLILPG